MSGLYLPPGIQQQVDLRAENATLRAEAARLAAVVERGENIIRQYRYELCRRLREEMEDLGLKVADSDDLDYADVSMVVMIDEWIQASLEPSK